METHHRCKRRRLRHFVLAPIRFRAHGELVRALHLDRKASRLVCWSNVEQATNSERLIELAAFLQVDRWSTLSSGVFLVANSQDSYTVCCALCLVDCASPRATGFVPTKSKVVEWPPPFSNAGHSYQCCLLFSATSCRNVNFARRQECNRCGAGELQVMIVSFTLCSPDEAVGKQVKKLGRLWEDLDQKLEDR